jgi:phenylalanyl-tRNA synthetase beta chain
MALCPFHLLGASGLGAAAFTHSIMQLPLSWLRQFCNPDLSDAELGEKLTMAGLELEELRAAAPAFSQVLVGEIQACAPHPDADRLRVCQVDADTGNLLQIVCGAPNARVGIRIPVAMVGAELPPGADGKSFKIKLGKLRGVESAGMLCSAKELGIDEDASGLYELPTDAPIGQSIRNYLQLDEQIATLKLTPNLGHCLSVLGVAREVAALTQAPLRLPAIAPVVATITDTLPVSIQAPDLCGRFAGRIVRGVNAQAKTPDWMVQKLARCGQRSISALVDISNFVMFELGQPSHMFDLDKVQGGLTVRWAQAGETLKLLNGQTVELASDIGVIADEAQIESLAGIMGGDATAVGNETKNIYIEAAFWWPDAIAGRARRLNFGTDAGHRYERGVDFALPPVALERITQLVLEICGGQAGPVQDQIAQLPQRQPVAMRAARAAQVIGLPLTAAQCTNAFARLDLPYTVAGDVITVTPPSYRFDLNIEADLIEEVLRMIGLDSLPLHPPSAPTQARVGSEKQRNRFALRRQMAALGYQEAITYSFIHEQDEAQLNGNADPVRLLNPIASQMNVMRSGLLPSLLEVLKRNLDRKAAAVRVFEWGRVFSKNAGVGDNLRSVQGIAQPMKLGGLAYGAAVPAQWGQDARSVDFYDVKADIEALFSAASRAKPAQAALEFIAPKEGEQAHPALHPGRSATVLRHKKPIGYIGELHPKWVQAHGLPAAPIVFELDAQALEQVSLPQAGAISRYQAAERDISVVLAEGISHAQIMQTISKAKASHLQNAVLYDIYRPQKEGGSLGLGEKSVTIALSLGSLEATLTDAQMDADVQTILQALQAQVGARLRA